MEARFRRVLSALALNLVLVLAALSSAVQVTAADLTLPAAESEMLRLLSARRTNGDLYAYRLDTRLTALARQRSQDMATRGYFSHTQPDGRDVFDLIAASGMTWYSAGEIIAWNNYPTIASSTTAAEAGWWGSPGHRSIVMSTGYNYVGIGVAVAADGRKFWTAITMRGPDRTGGWARMTGVTRAATTPDSAQLTTSWTGNDTRLQVLTAGFASYEVQRRDDAGAWKSIWRTTMTRVTRWYARGHRYEFRVRVIDRRGNAGAWSAPVAISA